MGFEPIKYQASSLVRLIRFHWYSPDFWCNCVHAPNPGCIVQVYTFNAKNNGPFREAIYRYIDLYCDNVPVNILAIRHKCHRSICTRSTTICYSCKRYTAIRCIFIVVHFVFITNNLQHTIIVHKKRWYGDISLTRIFPL